MNSKEFLSKVYKPGFMTIEEIIINDKKAMFTFKSLEPEVVKLSKEYLTPRGTHITASQAAYILLETSSSKFDLKLNSFRELFLDARMKLYEFYARFTKEVDLGIVYEGSIELSKFRKGKNPLVRLDYELADRAVSGFMSGMLVDKPVRQTNQNILR